MNYSIGSLSNVQSTTLSLLMQLNPGASGKFFVDIIIFIPNPYLEHGKYF